MMQKKVSDTIAALPDAPGVYVMKGADGVVFYVGKAKSLKDRVRSYFSGADTRAFVALLDRLLYDLEVVLTHSEKEALLLENELIKRHHPRFNVKLTDDKRFLCLRLDVRESYPRLEVVRRMAQDGARYFGPYSSASAIRETLRLVNRHFQLRTCSDQVLGNRTRPCLQYQIKRCPAPCVYNLQADGSYGQNVSNVTKFLDGRRDELLGDLRNRMHVHSEALEFEAAAALRDQIHAVQRSLERQRMVSPDFIDRDVIGVYREGPSIEIHVMRTREGRLSDVRRHSMEETEVPTVDVLDDFAARYYTREEDIPTEILLPEPTPWAETLAGVLAERAKHAVRVLTPLRGDKLALVRLASKNAHQAFMDKQREAGAARTAIEKLQRALHLRQAPTRMECFDISHIQGSQIVASAVRFENGTARRDLYRHYKIRTTTTQDDFKSMYEVVSRRARRGLEEGDLPDLMVIDGGKGQLGAARAALDDHGIDTVDLIGLAKSRSEDGAELEAEQADRARIPHARPNSAEARGTETASAPPASANVPSEMRYSAERVFLFGQKNPIVLRQNSAELFLLTRARDEAHRFAITFHRKLRGKAATRSGLDDVPGIGPKRRQALLKAFGSVGRLQQATQTDVAKVIGAKAAAAVAQTLHLKEAVKSESEDDGASPSSSSQT